jgi:hypothetical protein
MDHDRHPRVAPSSPQHALVQDYAPSPAPTAVSHPVGIARPPTSFSPLALQQTLGNQAVQRLIQPKRLYNAMPRDTIGSDSLITNYANNTHATVYPDSQDFATKLAFTFLSRRWVSVFHITQNAGAVRAFFTDEGVAINTALNRGSAAQIQALSVHKDAYLAKINQNAQLYTETQAQAEELRLAAIENVSAKNDQKAVASKTASDSKAATAAIRTDALAIAKQKLAAPTIEMWFAFFKANKDYAKTSSAEAYIAAVTAQSVIERARIDLTTALKATITPQTGAAAAATATPQQILTAFATTNQALIQAAKVDMVWLNKMYAHVTSKQAAPAAAAAGK